MTLGPALRRLARSSNQAASWRGQTQFARSSPALLPLQTGNLLIFLEI